MSYHVHGIIREGLFTQKIVCEKTTEKNFWLKPIFNQVDSSWLGTATIFIVPGVRGQIDSNLNNFEFQSTSKIQEQLVWVRETSDKENKATEF